MVHNSQQLFYSPQLTTTFSEATFQPSRPYINKLMVKFLYFLGKNQWLEDPQEIKKNTGPKEKGRKNQAKKQNHKNQAGQQYTKILWLWKIIMSYGKKRSPTKQKQLKKNREKKIPHAHGGGQGRRRGVEMRNVDT
jgi:hypothetical protein